MPHPWNKGTPESFWAKGVRNGACLIFSGQRSNWGYGRLYYHGKTWNASRLAWTLARGPIPDGLQVCHTCDNPPCIEPLHLFLGTGRDNQRDMIAKGRRNDHFGIDNPHGRLTDEQVREMRRLRVEGWSYKQLADRFQTSPGAAWAIVVRRSRSHVR